MMIHVRNIWTERHLYSIVKNVLTLSCSWKAQNFENEASQVHQIFSLKIEYFENEFLILFRKINEKSYKTCISGRQLDRIHAMKGSLRMSHTIAAMSQFWNLQQTLKNKLHTD